MKNFWLFHKVPKYLFFLLVALGYTCQSTYADEGMWLVSQISRNVKEMQALGFKLTAEDIYSINNSSLKDAAVLLDDGGCSAEIVSSKGLVLTNHHCAITDIQALSSMDRNYIRDGFWAKHLGNELPVPGKSALILKRVEDVTATVLQGLENETDPKFFFERVDVAIKQIKSSVESKEKGVHARVVHMFNHNEFYLFIYNRYTDVRLVGAPPASIGNFGGDVDNWHWPRHTGDFALYRIYTAPNGMPANFSKKNIPLKPLHHFPISLKGVQEGDFTMVLGFPGTTYRFSSSSQALLNRDGVAPWVDKYWGEFIASIKDGMKSDPKVKIYYTDTHDGLVNFWQKDVWQAQAMKRFNVVEALQHREDSLFAWASNDNPARNRFKNSIPTIKDYYKEVGSKHYEELHRSLTALTSWPVGISKFYYEIFNLFDLMYAEKPSKRKIKKEAKRISKNLDKIYEGYNSHVDMQLYSIALRSLVNYLPSYCTDGLLVKLKETETPDLIIPLVTKYMFEKSYFSSPQALKSFLANPSIDSLANDPLFMLNMSYELLMKQIQDSVALLAPEFKFAMRSFTKGIIQMNPDKLFYPDANSTLRVSYGKVIGYQPTDGVSYRYFTTLDGKIEKNDPSEDVFTVPERMIDLWKRRDYGIYADSTGTMPLCFITDNDITNGNSGSPVLNANGHLIGVAFDGNHEAMACDYAYEPSMQRTIICDIRYVLFVIDKFAGAKHLVDEMTIIQ